MASKKQAQTSFDCVTFKQHDQDLFLFAAPAKELDEILSVSRRKEDSGTKGGYQRVLQPARVKAMARFVEAGNYIAPALVVSLDGDSHYDEKSKKIVIPKRKDAGWVIDGQHRLAGVSSSKQDQNLAVVAFVGLDIQDQINQFITINKEQKGVPSSLYLDLLPDLVRPKASAEIAKERAADIAQKLKSDEGSPFFGKILSTTPPTAGRELSLVNFVRKVQPLIQDGRGILSAYSFEEQVRVFDNYFSGIRAQHPRLFGNAKSVIFKTIGFGALMNAFPVVFSTCVKKYGSFRVDDVSNIFEEIQFDFSSWNELGSGNAAEVSAGQDLMETIRSANSSDESSASIKLD